MLRHLSKEYLFIFTHTYIEEKNTVSYSKGPIYKDRADLLLSFTFFIIIHKKITHMYAFFYTKFQATLSIYINVQNRPTNLLNSTFFFSINIYTRIFFSCWKTTFYYCRKKSVLWRENLLSFPGKKFSAKYSRKKCRFLFTEIRSVLPVKNC